ncbi:MAG: aminoglycoside phosphotransferase family protein [candidate division KSB1 bacterium]|nr:aminoglycoside phosphotransferase family protein [candidate division KSB1 bacterium]MDZ7302413.1 aminoglycoside phosphotransferase family protein [candidate division KSB1 bacterium]MDZ7311615.1 aminoglycoside phosphotransferase family protein [candidate division KSB1 bacterium]
MVRIDALPEDKCFPQLPVVTDVAVMKDLLARQLPGFAEGELQINDLTLTDFQHKPGKRCQVCYSVQVKDVVTGNEGDQIFLGIVEPNGTAEAQYAKARREAHFQPQFGRAVHWLPELSMVLWAFPNEPRLKRLPDLLDEKTLLELLHKHGASLSIPFELRLIGIDTQVVKYAPLHRCTLKHRLYFENAVDVIIFSKIYSHKTDAAALFKIQRSLWNAPVCRSGELIIPEPLFCESVMNVIFQRGINGRNLDEQLDQLDLEDTAAKIGRALAGIHQSSLEGLSPRQAEYELAECADAKAKLLELNPDYASQLAGIVTELEKRWPALTPLAPTPIHGAFRLTQVLLVGEKIALVDFDGFLLGNPISDVGSFVAYLLYLPYKGLISAAQSRSAIHAFCHAYAEKAPWGLPADSFAWYTAAYLLGREAKKCLGKSTKVSKRDYQGMIGPLLEMAKGILDS